MRECYNARMLECIGKKNELNKELVSLVTLYGRGNEVQCLNEELTKKSE